jgi:hypothetical protein
MGRPRACRSVWNRPSASLKRFISGGPVPSPTPPQARRNGSRPARAVSPGRVGALTALALCPGLPWPPARPFPRLPLPRADPSPRRPLRRPGGTGLGPPEPCRRGGSARSPPSRSAPVGPGRPRAPPPPRLPVPRADPSPRRPLRRPGGTGLGPPEPCRRAAPPGSAEALRPVVSPRTVDRGRPFTFRAALPALARSPAALPGLDLRRAGAYHSGGSGEEVRRWRARRTSGN